MLSSWMDCVVLFILDGLWVLLSLWIFLEDGLCVVLSSLMDCVVLSFWMVGCAFW